MNILYLSPIFETSTDPGSDRYLYLLRRLVEKGHNVTVITSAVIYKEARLRDACRGHLVTKTTIDGIAVTYLWSFARIRGSFVRRLFYLVTFMALALLKGLFVERPDVIYSPNSPGMVGYAAYVLARVRSIPLVFEVADVWPDAGIAMGTITSRPLIAVMRWMEHRCYRYATRVTALTRGIKACIESKGYPAEKVLLATNGVDPGAFLTVDVDKARVLRKQFGLSEKFVAAYLGAHGHYNSLWTIIEAANLLKAEDRFAFVLIGDGDYKARLQEMVQGYGLTNVLFLPPVSRRESPAYLAMADVFLLPNRKGDFFRMNLPNKLFDYLISNRPIIVAGLGETADVVLKAGAGLVVPAEDAAGMAEALRQLLQMPAWEREYMGEHGRVHVLRHYQRDATVEVIETALQAASRNPSLKKDKEAALERQSS